MDKKAYADDWNDTIRPSILKRDRYKCSDCGIKHRSRVYRKSKGGYQICDEFIETWAKSKGHKVFTLYLQVAHLDHNKLNNDPSNLISKCPRCHGKYDRHHKAALRNMVLVSKPDLSTADADSDTSLLDKKIVEIRAFIRQETGQNLSRESLVTLVSLILKSK